MSIENGIPEHEQDPSENLDYSLLWVFEGAPDTIVSAQWFVRGVGLTLGTGPKAPTNDATSTTFWVSGGTRGQRYYVDTRVLTAGGRTIERSTLIAIRDL